MDSQTTVSIYRTNGTELFIRFPDRKNAYFWAVQFMYRWAHQDSQLVYFPFEEKDSSSWGCQVALSSNFDIFLYNGGLLYDRSNEWYETHDLGYNIVSADYAAILGIDGEPCNCKDPCMHDVDLLNW